MPSDITADPGPDTASLDTASTGESQVDAASAGGASPQTDSAQAVNPEVDGSASLKSGDTTPPTTQQKQPGTNATQPPPNEDWKRRHDAQITANRRIASELKERDRAFQDLQGQFKQMQDQLKGVQPNEIQQLLQQRQNSAKPVWHPNHPDHSRFQNLLQSQAHYTRLMQRAQTDDQKKWVMEQFNADVPAEDQRLLQQYHDYGRQEQAKLLTDPTGYLQQQVAPMIQAELQKFQQNTVGSYEQTMAAKQELSSLLQRYPELNKTEHLQRAMELTSRGYPMRAALMEIRADLLESRVSSADLAKASVEEKERLLRSDASITRDSAVNTKIDLYSEARKIAKERGIDNPFDPRHLRIQDELRKKYNIKG